MKTIQLLFIALLAATMNISCSAKADSKKETTQINKSDKVEVLYFHYSRRCATCNAVESVTKKAIAELYGNKVSFVEYNLDEKQGETKGKELKISGQTLLIVSGNNKINITNEGFMNARNNPDKLKQIIKEKIDPLL